MLTMIQIHLIRHLMFKKGLSYRGIAGDTGHNFRTVKKYIEKVLQGKAFPICYSLLYFLLLLLTSSTSDD
jgi:hypothetical protein